MAQQGNPFYVNPALATADVAGTLQGLGKQMQQQRQFDQNLAIREEEKAAEIAQARKKFIQEKQQQQQVEGAFRNVLEGVDVEENTSFLLANAPTAYKSFAEDLAENEDQVLKQSLAGFNSMTPAQQATAIDNDLIPIPDSVKPLYEIAKDKGAFLGALSAISTGEDENYVQSSEIYDDGTSIQNLKKGGLQVVTPGGKILTGEPARKHMLDVKKKSFESKQKLKKLEVDSAMAKERAKGLVAREKEDIDLGINAAQQLPLLHRANKLLDIVETGKPQEAIKYAKSIWGIETGDAGELDNILGNMIIKQLKPTFGGSFTKSEGDWLKDMEANFGKSTVVNRRLVRQGIGLAEKRANIGYDTAVGANDPRTAQVIQEYMTSEIKDLTKADDREDSDIDSEYGIE